ncbi:1-(5-phosphoribosyl)-5-[(5-phosphoribosylamino)methylideneamino] imidazole-4-carboxamide isomerase [Rhodonellum psychrophilum GCM71 = DSM 17998]|uniref:1-(5-phosphoribosyl)-5-[(5-phosphoribosylamino)methylideneamino] imidazole-4-carboxamide isomerase n=2 Tax=Rhodonellum TaxID=336827 RepID=U5C6N4_9BACT|nr:MULTISPECIES: 1-(5-phosphoribosyl)-5-[(5-phosphoribosylamino)methylideneamino] imidazole-4-carboxamide isomerase [Rhodonellum]ERM83832.1 1-(5-phosphoribosyl)-5-[(5-phosphoribosylamino)methylideneamino] imidazole-4-carboxamide isomerase [Rhodonellum psychrophilum GCM71 = DSM 17998]MDO9554387.1 1-(5-phosphoribosyl)-5-[(5-phosphoribosylamino)methylideneamino] imidazole-4-carboxamide isomerase [Rhodonellum sp.]SDY66333.1 1-(5-phosphoribosyl)-5-[(5-phosphoribosylamino)methylideneamino] imidazole-4
MFEIIPSIWLINGKCVRLKRGDFATEQVISNNPLEIAQAFEDHGIKRIHLVDLDGAKRGEPKNYHILEAITGYTNLLVDFTGGISTDGDVIKAFEHGAKTITAASIAAKDPDKFAQWLVSYGRERINLAADTDPQNHKVIIGGWLKKTEIDLFEHIENFYEKGLKYLKCSDITRDGVSDGPNFELYAQIREKFPEIFLAASGGVRSIDDFKRLRDMGLKAAVFGRAYYENIIKLEDLDKFIAETN